MKPIPQVTIYVRHKLTCKHKGNEFHKGCSCKKWLRWTKDGVRERRPAQTSSWEQAELVRDDVRAELSGKVPTSEPDAKNLRAAIEVFIADKRVENLSGDLIKKYERELGRLATFCESRRVFTLNGIDRELVTRFCEDWTARYPSSITRNKLRERYKSFGRFCVEAGWVKTVPNWPKMKPDEVPTLPLTDDEYAKLLDAVYVVVKAPEHAVVENQSYDYWCRRVRGLFLLMRWSGLSIQDALTLPRSELIKDGRVHRVVTQRTKTGTDVSVVIPPDVAAELLAVPNDNNKYLFWSGVGNAKSICGNWGKRFVSPCFKEAGIEGGHMKSHRLRDTFACRLLTAGVSLEHVSKLLGHTSLRTTEKSYSAWVPARQEVLDNAVASAWAKAPASVKRPGRKRAA